MLNINNISGYGLQDPGFELLRQAAQKLYPEAVAQEAPQGGYGHGELDEQVRLARLRCPGDEQLAALRPEFALIGVGAGNEYGHPTQETLGALQRAGAKVYRTDLDGDISVAFTEAGMGVTVQKDDDGHSDR